MNDASYSADAPELFDERLDTPMTNQEYEDYINQAGPVRQLQHDNSRSVAR